MAGGEASAAPLRVKAGLVDLAATSGLHRRCPVSLPGGFPLAKLRLTRERLMVRGGPRGAHLPRRWPGQDELRSRWLGVNGELTHEAPGGPGAVEVLLGHRRSGLVVVHRPMSRITLFPTELNGRDHSSLFPRREWLGVIRVEDGKVMNLAFFTGAVAVEALRAEPCGWDIDVQQKTIPLPSRLPVHLGRELLLAAAAS